MLRIATVFVFLFLVLSATGTTTIRNVKSLSPTVTMRMPRKSFRNFGQRARNRRRRRRQRILARLDCQTKQNTKFRTLSGVCNNQDSPNRGAADQPFIASLDKFRLNFSDHNLPNARTISNIVHTEPQFIPNDRGMSELIIYFGQFLDHIVTEFHVDENDPLNIEIPEGDKGFEPGSFIRMFRSVKVPFRQSQFGSPENQLSSYVDGTFHFAPIYFFLLTNNQHRECRVRS